MNESLRQAQGKKVLFFGIYDPNYSRNAVLMLGFRENGWEVDECRIDPKQVGGLRKYLQLWKEGKKLKGDKFNLIIVAFPGHTVVWLARLLFGKKIIFDMFVSLYNSEVEDRGNVNRMWNYLLDWYSVRQANLSECLWDQLYDRLLPWLKYSSTRYFNHSGGPENARK